MFLCSQSWNEDNNYTTKELASQFAMEKYLSSKKKRKKIESRNFGGLKFTQKFIVLYTATTNIAQTWC